MFLFVADCTRYPERGCRS